MIRPFEAPLEHMLSPQRGEERAASGSGRGKGPCAQAQSASYRRGETAAVASSADMQNTAGKSTNLPRSGTLEGRILTIGATSRDANIAVASSVVALGPTLMAESVVNQASRGFEAILIRRSISQNPTKRMLPREIEAMSQSTVKSAGRILSILEYFGHVQREVTVGEVSKSLEFPQSSTSTLMQSLVNRGYLYQDAKGRAYGPTMKMALLGEWVRDNFLADRGVIRLMESMNESAGYSVVLAVRNGLNSEYIRVVQEITNPFRVHTRAGKSHSLFRSGTGLMLLSAMNDDQVKRLAIRANAERSANEPRIDVSAILLELDRIRRRGYAFSRGSVTPGVGLIAKLLPTAPVGRPAALGLAGPLEDFERNEERIVSTMSADIEKYLGTSIEAG